MKFPLPWIASSAWSILALALALSAAGLGCGGSAPTVAATGRSVAPVDPATAGSLSVHLVKDGVGAELQQLNLAITALEVRVDGAWRPVALDRAPEPRDLLACTSQEPLALATREAWPQGDNDAVRITLDPATATVQRQDDYEPRPLVVPARFVVPMGLPGAFSVSQGQETDLWIAFGVDQAVQALPEDPEQPDAPAFALVPGRVRGYPRAATSFITGRVVAPAPAGATPEGIPHAVVTAQLPVAGGAAGGAYAARTVQADAEGNFTLDLLARGAAYTWTAVSGVATGSPAYAGAAGDPAGPLGNGPPYDTFECLVSPVRVLTTGSLGGTAALAPGPGRGARVDLVQAFALDPVLPVTGPLVVASAPLGADGHFTFGSGLPAGVYTAVLHRFRQDADLAMVDEAVASDPFLVTAGAATTIAF